MQVYLIDSNGASTTTVDVDANPQYVDNYFVSNEWTRVKIPLTAFGITGAPLLLYHLMLLLTAYVRRVRPQADDHSSSVL